MRVLRAAVSVAAVLLAAACGNRGDTQEGDSRPSPSDVVGTWGEPSAESSTPHFTFDSDGTYRGFDGCNSVTGSWTLSEEGTLVTDLESGSTKACLDQQLPDT